MTKKTVFLREFHFIRYHGSLLVLIILGILLQIPLILALFLRNGEFVRQRVSYRTRYKGSYGWLYFWAIFFFPIMIILLIIKGIEILEVIDSPPVIITEIKNNQ